MITYNNNDDNNNSTLVHRVVFRKHPMPQELAGGSPARARWARPCSGPGGMDIQLLGMPGKLMESRLF